MPIVFACPGCGKKLSVPENMAGRAAKCPCGTPIQIPAAANSQAPAQNQVSQGQPSQGQPAQHPAAQNPLAPNPTAPQQQPAATAVASMQPAAGTVPPGGLPVGGALNPDFKVQCLQCGTEYPMRPDLFGQTVACRCGAPIRFEDPLGAGGSLMKDPLKPEGADSGPLAYQSLSSDDDVKKVSRKKEAEILKMYIKDEEEFEKSTKVKKKPAGGIAALTSSQDDAELSVVRVISAIATILVIIGLGVGMILAPDLGGEMSIGEALEEGLTGLIVKLLWCMPTGIILCVIGGILIVVACIFPKKTFLLLSSYDTDDEDDE